MIHLISKQINKNEDLNQQQRDDLISLTNATVNKNFFQLYQKEYQMQERLPMGGPLSPIPADVFISHIRETILNSKHNIIKYITAWHGYIDHIIWEGSFDLLLTFKT